MTGPLLRVEGLTKSFGGLRALANLSFSLNAGEVLGLIGPNGSGKTTTVNVITGIYAGDGGRVTMAGHDITGRRPEVAARAGLARTFQNLRLFNSFSVLDNVRAAQNLLCRSLLTRFGFGGTAEERSLLREARALIDRLGLADVEREPAGALPYGKRKRLEIARALALRPKVLLLDEPAAGMTPVELEWLIGVIGSIAAEGMGILLIEHHMKLVMSVCHRVDVIDFGEKIASGTPAEIVQNPAVIGVYLGKAA